MTNEPTLVEPCEKHDVDWKKDQRCRRCGENFWNPGKD